MQLSLSKVLTREPLSGHAITPHQKAPGAHHRATEPPPSLSPALAACEYRPTAAAAAILALAVGSVAVVAFLSHLHAQHIHRVAKSKKFP